MRGRGMKGHRRILTPVGDIPPGYNRTPVGGWALTCLCGWVSGNFPSRRPAQEAYTGHIDYVIDEVPTACRRCGVAKPRTQMRRDYRYVCLDCASKLGNEWQRENPNRAAKHKRSHHLLKKYGITAAEADAILAAQDGKCAICAQKIVDVRGYEPHVDHDHATGAVRGVLCFHCNCGLGQFGDNIDRMRAAVAYLESHQGRTVNVA